jgi:cytochrome oxidase Cu insertion factor (SCO1/SenC/PrrC family)
MTCDPAFATPRVWAAYSGTASGDGISLHKTEREALEAVVEGLGIDYQEDEDHTRPATMAEASDDDIRERLDEYTSTRSDDWCVQEVELP